jgi:hypothetical protein
VAEKATGGEEFLRRLVRDDEALVEALRREREGQGRMRCDRPGVRGRVYIGPGPRDSCPPSQPLVLLAETLIERHVSGGKKSNFSKTVHAL